MKVPVFAAKSLYEFLQVATELGQQEIEDGVVLTVYGMEMAAPEQCPKPACRPAPLRRNGCYLRQVIEGTVWILVRICRFRCGRCGKTVSCPYSFLVPHRRFTARLICQSIVKYGRTIEGNRAEILTSYRSISDDLSAVCLDGDGSGECPEVSPVPSGAFLNRDRACPARTTVFTWIDFVCKKIEKLVQHIAKELVLRGANPAVLPAERTIRNVHAWKAGRLARYIHQQNKPSELNKLSYAFEIGRGLVEEDQDCADKLRTHFLRFAENFFDMLSDVAVLTPTAQSFEQPD